MQGSATLVTIVCQGCHAALHYPVEMLRERATIRCAGCERETPLESLGLLVPLERLEAVLPPPSRGGPWDEGRFSDFVTPRRT